MIPQPMRKVSMVKKMDEQELNWKLVKWAGFITEGRVNMSDENPVRDVVVKALNEVQDGTKRVDYELDAVRVSAYRMGFNIRVDIIYKPKG